MFHFSSRATRLGLAACCLPGLLLMSSLAHSDQNRDVTTPNASAAIETIVLINPNSNTDATRAAVEVIRGDEPGQAPKI
ncbi:hypothetical protein C1H69_18400 [Billgrantia endophytica]|uniref:Uncharacterized protein n=1 Tax=Billgrantia endophytica TaxID=2033802 RepID=A0A2N7TYN6_9GAMM|nr:hypothetical protein C1H69_18400 [Halomonas endophytica]